MRTGMRCSDFGSSDEEICMCFSCVCFFWCAPECACVLVSFVDVAVLFRFTMLLLSPHKRCVVWMCRIAAPSASIHSITIPELPLESTSSTCTGTSKSEGEITTQSHWRSRAVARPVWIDRSQVTCLMQICLSRVGDCLGFVFRSARTMCCPARSDVIKSNCELPDLRWNVNVGIGDVSHTLTLRGHTMERIEKMTPYPSRFLCACLCVLYLRNWVNWVGINVTLLQFGNVEDRRVPLQGTRDGEKMEN